MLISACSTMGDNPTFAWKSSLLMRLLFLALLFCSGWGTAMAGEMPMDTLDNWQIYLNKKIIAQGHAGSGVQVTLSRSALKETDVFEIHYHTCTMYESIRTLYLEYDGTMHLVYTSPAAQNMTEPIYVLAEVLLHAQKLPERFNLYVRIPGASMDNKSGWLGEIVLTP